MFTSRKRRLFHIIVLAAIIAAALGSRGLSVRIINQTSAPMHDVTLSHPGGTIVVAKVGPGESVRRTVRRPLAGLWGTSSEVPLELTFAREGRRSRPFAVRCAPGWAAARKVDFEVREHRWNSPNGVVRVDATMIGARVVNYRRLSRGLLDPASGFRRFYAYRMESTGADVLNAPSPAETILAGARRVGRFLLPIELAVPRPDVRPLIFQTIGVHVSPPTAPRAARLPFRDPNEAIEDLRNSLWHTPLYP